jgi:hypothetical protein
VEIHAAHGGWPVYERFFRDYNRRSLEDIPILERYHVPLP